MDSDHTDGKAAESNSPCTNTYLSTSTMHWNKFIFLNSYNGTSIPTII